MTAPAASRQVVKPGGLRHQGRGTSSIVRRVLPAVAALLAALVAVPPAGAQEAASQPPTAEEQLAQKYAPIAYLKRQDFECDPGGESYLMAPVEIAFGDPEVALRRVPGREELKRAPTNADLFAGDASKYIDLPGDPREPLCNYERHFRARMGDQRPVVYAHVAVEPGKGLAVQYWFWYYFNDFNDKHESDWEMIQVNFAADSVAEALAEEPVSVAFSQHAGGETAPWNGDKLRKEDGHPVTYPSRGSHGNYYGPGIWVGWGENRSGLGCDNTTGPSVRVAPEVRLIPDEVGDPDHPFAWSTFEGHWGEREAWVYDGPKGPIGHVQWRKPITWAEGLRDSSLKLQSGDAVGTSPASIFCALVRGGSDVYTLSKVHPWAVGVTLAVLLALAVVLVVLAAPVLRAAAGVYFPHIWAFVKIGAVLVPVGIAANLLHYLIVTNPPVETAVKVTDDAPLIPSLIALTLGNFQHIAMLVLVGPAVVQAVADIRAGRPPSFGRAYRVVLDKLGALAGAAIRSLVIILALAVTIFGIPWAVARLVRWSFFGQAVVLDGAGATQALATSARAVAGHWWRVLGIGAVLVFVAALLGPLIGIPLMIFAEAPLHLVNGLSGFVYAFTHPFAVVGGTLLYQRLKQDR